ncbi:MAG: efflux RND transporter periplasmic adaptor subunit [Candidatus Pacebacteria bacterium]|nr:efflux RND transporter periplasmic adaptor subunit [Candidatus Paceibacterota bacterium]
MIKNIIKSKISIFLVIIIGCLGYYIFGTSNNQTSETKYTIAQAEKGTIMNSVSGTGQVSAYNQAAVNSSVEGDIIKLNIKAGDEVDKDQIIVVVDSTEAREKISNAEDALETAKLSLEKTKRGLRDEELAVSQLDIENKKEAIITAEKDLETVKNDAVNDLEDVKDKAQTDLNKVYNDYIAEIKNAMDKSVDAIYFITDIQYAHFNDNSQEGIKLASGKSGIVKDLFGLDDGGRANVNTLDKARAGIRAEILSLQETKDKDKANELYIKIRDILSRTKDVINAIPLNDSVTTTEKTNILTRKTTIENEISTLTNKRQDVIDQEKTNNTNIDDITKKNEESIKAATDKIETAKTSLESAEKQLTLKTSIDPYEIKTQEMNVKQKENALQEAKDSLNDYYIKAPFAGVVASVSAELGNYVSGGSAIATIITKKQMAEITLNEVDIANIKVGQKATLTFDAIENLTVTGEVVEIALIGTVSQGVVSYPVKIILNDSNDKIKSGMSTSVSIIIDFKQDAIMVPASAVKTANNTSYILIPSSVESIDKNNLPTEAIRLSNNVEQKTVETGKTSDDYIEVTSGLEEGDLIITKTVTSTVKSTSSQGQSLFQFGGRVR